LDLLYGEPLIRIFDQEKISPSVTFNISVRIIHNWQIKQKASAEQRLFVLEWHIY